MMLRWESWVNAGRVIIILSLFWFGTEVLGGGGGTERHGFWLIFCQLCKVFWSSSESSQVPAAFIMVSRIWIMACRDSVKSFDKDEQSSDVFIRIPQSIAVQWAVCASFKGSQPDMLSACSLMFARSSSENIPRHSELFNIWLHHVFLWITREPQPEMFFWYNWALLLPKSNFTPFPSIPRLLLGSPRCL